MKKYLIFLAANIVLFVALQAVFIFTGFSLGLASSDKYLREQWILYCVFCFLHLIIYAAAPYFRRLLSNAEFLLGILIIILSWVILGLYIS
jgi:hypothetical protein